MLTRLLIYTKKMDEMVTFYTTHFGFRAAQADGDRIVELLPIQSSGGAAIMLHAAAKSQREGQAMVKLVFHCTDVHARKAELMQAGLTVGPVMDGGGYEFANMKDPGGNSVQISSRPGAYADV